MDTPQYRAVQLAAELVAMSDAADAAIRARQLVQQAQTIVTDRPGDEPSNYQLREWARQKAMTENPPVMTPGGAAPQDYVIVTPDGTPHVVRQTVPPVAQVIGPAEWDEFDRAWRAQKRQAEDALLLDTYGGTAREAGLL
jgi:hypothetical protein